MARCTLRFPLVRGLEIGGLDVRGGFTFTLYENQGFQSKSKPLIQTTDEGLSSFVWVAGCGNNSKKGSPCTIFRPSLGLHVPTLHTQIAGTVLSALTQPGRGCPLLEAFSKCCCPKKNNWLVFRC